MYLYIIILAVQNHVDVQGFDIFMYP